MLIIGYSLFKLLNSLYLNLTNIYAHFWWYGYIFEPNSLTEINISFIHIIYEGCADPYKARTSVHNRRWIFRQVCIRFTVFGWHRSRLNPIGRRQLSKSLIGWHTGSLWLSCCPVHQQTHGLLPYPDILVSLTGAPYAEEWTCSSGCRELQIPFCFRGVPTLAGWRKTSLCLLRSQRLK